jgi:hypothetical protein
MGTTTVNTNPDKQELRKFGLVFATAMVLIFGLFFPWLLERPWPTWPWIVAAAFAVPALLFPQVLKHVFLLWMKIGHALGWINSRIILGILFFLMFAPVALVLRLLGKDMLKQRLDASATTYRIASEQLPRDRMERPY